MFHRGLNLRLKIEIADVKEMTMEFPAVAYDMKPFQPVKVQWS